MLSNVLVAGLLTVVAPATVTTVSDSTAISPSTVVATIAKIGCAETSGSWVPGTLRIGDVTAPADQPEAESQNRQGQDQTVCALA